MTLHTLIAQNGMYLLWQEANCFNFAFLTSWKIITHFPTGKSPFTLILPLLRSYSPSCPQLICMKVLSTPPVSIPALPTPSSGHYHLDPALISNGTTLIKASLCHHTMGTFPLFKLSHVTPLTLSSVDSLSPDIPGLSVTSTTSPAFVSPLPIDVEIPKVLNFPTCSLCLISENYHTLIVTQVLRFLTHTSSCQYPEQQVRAHTYTGLACIAIQIQTV